jgi:hypothetical protein
MLLVGRDQEFARSPRVASRMSSVRMQGNPLTSQNIAVSGERHNVSLPFQCETHDRGHRRFDRSESILPNVNEKGAWGNHPGLLRCMHEAKLRYTQGSSPGTLSMVCITR